MKRTLLFPICIIIIAIVIRVFDNSDSSQNTKKSKETTESKQPKVIAPTNKAYYIKIKEQKSWKNTCFELVFLVQNNIVLNDKTSFVIKNIILLGKKHP